MSRNRSMTPVLLVVGTVFLVAASTAMAQPRGPRQGGGGFGGPGGGGPGGMDKMSLLRSDQVIEELGVSEEQQGKIRTVMDESRTQQRELFSGLRDLSESERREKMQELRTKFQEMGAKTNASVAGILTESQNKRLDEIMVQVRGLHGLAGEEMAEKLGLSSDQKEGIKDLVAAEREELQGQFAKMREASPEERREMFTKMREQSQQLRDQTDKMIKEELTPEQSKKLDEMMGKPFELDREALFRGGRRPGGEGRGPRGEGRGPRGEGRRPGGQRTPDAGGNRSI